MNGESIHHTRTETDRRHFRADYWQTEKTWKKSSGHVEGYRESKEHVFRHGKECEPCFSGRSAKSIARAGLRYIGYRATEHVSAFWYALATFDLIMAIILFGIVITPTTTLEAPTRRIEYIRQTPIYDSSEHTEVLEIGKLLDESKVYMLAHLIGGEAGADWCTDELQLMVGSVVLNRMADERFPNEMYDVIFQKGQYSTTWNGAYEKETYKIVQGVYFGR